MWLKICSFQGLGGPRAAQTLKTSDSQPNPKPLFAKAAFGNRRPSRPVPGPQARGAQARDPTWPSLNLARLGRRITWAQLNLLDLCCLRFAFTGRSKIRLQATTVQECFKKIATKRVEAKTWSLTPAEVADWWDTMAKRLRNLLHDTHITGKKAHVPKWFRVMPWLKTEGGDANEVGSLCLAASKKVFDLRCSHTVAENPKPPKAWAQAFGGLGFSATACETLSAKNCFEAANHNEPSRSRKTATRLLRLAKSRRHRATTPRATMMRLPTSTRLASRRRRAQLGVCGTENL